MTKIISRLCSKSRWNLEAQVEVAEVLALDGVAFRLLEACLILSRRLNPLVRIYDTSANLKSQNPAPIKGIFFSFLFFLVFFSFFFFFFHLHIFQIINKLDYDWCRKEILDGNDCGMLWVKQFCELTIIIHKIQSYTWRKISTVFPF